MVICTGHRGTFRRTQILPCSRGWIAGDQDSLLRVLAKKVRDDVWTQCAAVLSNLLHGVEHLCCALVKLLEFSVNSSSVWTRPHSILNRSDAPPEIHRCHFEPVHIRLDGLRIESFCQSSLKDGECCKGARFGVVCLLQARLESGHRIRSISGLALAIEIAATCTPTQGQIKGH